MSDAWSIQEVNATVESYFEMLRQELANQNYNKSAHRRELLPLLNDRTERAIESKHQNISAILTESKMPSINGYKPLFNYQNLLADRVLEFLNTHPEFYDYFERDVTSTPEKILITDFSKVIVEPPKNEDMSSINENRVVRFKNSINYLEKEVQNSLLGAAGEEFVIACERDRLIRSGKENLADKIERISETQGDWAGFDILSFEEDGTDRYIEAKTTRYGKSIPFFITPNELAFSERNSQRYHLYRVFNYRQSPELFILKGNIHNQCRLTPTEYRATVK
jgi:hypothetical protein